MDADFADDAEKKKLTQRRKGAKKTRKPQRRGEEIVNAKGAKVAKKMYLCWYFA